MKIKKSHNSKDQDEINLFESRNDTPINLNQLIMIQQDEPNQRSCIYKLNKKVDADGNSVTP